MLYDLKFLRITSASRVSGPARSIAGPQPLDSLTAFPQLPPAGPPPRASFPPLPPTIRSGPPPPLLRRAAASPPPLTLRSAAVTPPLPAVQDAVSPPPLRPVSRPIEWRCLLCDVKMPPVDIQRHYGARHFKEYSHGHNPVCSRCKNYFMSQVAYVTHRSECPEIFMD